MLGRADNRWWFAARVGGLVWLLLCAGIGQATETATPPGSAAQFDRVWLVDGRELSGLIETRDADGLAFLELPTDANGPLAAIGWRIPSDLIAEVAGIPPAQRQALRERVDGWRQSPFADELAGVRLTEVPGANRQAYTGPWFSLETTLDEPLAAEMVLRLQRVFAACRLLLPERGPGQRELRVVVSASLDECRAEQARRGLQIDHPAWYDARSNEIVVGTELARWADQWSQQRRRQQELRAEVRELETNLTELLRQQGREALEQGAPRGPLQRANLIRRQRLESQLKQLRDELARTVRQADALFQSATQRAFAALHHEALHAWLENRAYPADEFDVPRWLNEGLAQMFEVSLSSWGELRLDGVDATRRRALRTDLHGPQPLALAAMLTAEPQQFLVEHGGGSPASQQHYLYAWGVTQYLVVDRHLLGTQALDDYLAARHEGTGAVPRFEALVGEPLADFERRWRRWLLGE